MCRSSLIRSQPRAGSCRCWRLGPCSGLCWGRFPSPGRSHLSTQGQGRHRSWVTRRSSRSWYFSRASRPEKRSSAAHSSWAGSSKGGCPLTSGPSSRIWPLPRPGCTSNTTTKTTRNTGPSSSCSWSRSSGRMGSARKSANLSQHTRTITCPLDPQSPVFSYWNDRGRNSTSRAYSLSIYLI